MNFIFKISILFVFCYVKHATSKCEITAFPPDPKTQCCGQDSATYSKIYSSEAPAMIDEYPWVALLEHVKDGQAKTLCGGALISGKYVLTAGHCVTSQTIQSVGNIENIILGEYDTRTEGPDCVIAYSGGEDCTDGVVKIPVEKIIVHPEYNQKEKKNDIALIRMTRMAPYTDFISPICLPTEDITQKTGEITLNKAGWGTTDGGTRSPVKLQFRVPFIPQDKCQAAYKIKSAKITLWKGHICAGGENLTDFCKGDAGTPLAYGHGRVNEVVGIVSFGPQGCLRNPPIVYTNVYEYLPWINSNIVA